ncbi:MAG: ribosome assembly cofactor RimP [Spirochaetae bacterium HGW-Spirochaetae-3]|jgi:ribosome maturation factor RimP|nr:MAG: ribosome assembly cofactor RimP [Spirochaetae bacterium HGW-Spirochaetae-3]
MTESQELYNDIATLLSGIGLELVDLHVSRNKGSSQASAVIYRAGGTGIDECSKAHRLIQARLEVLLGNDDFQLETASPGVDRTIRSAREYAIFAGRGVRLFLEDEDTVEGVITSSDGSVVIVATADGERSVAIERIRKGKLDYSQEGR